MATVYSVRGSVTGGVRIWLRLEAAAAFVIALLLYARTGAGWGVFGALFLVPDLSLLGYLAGPRAGAISYNSVHSSVGPLALAAVALAGVVPGALPFALIWGAHVALDRAVGYGLKYTSAFGDTHLGHVGRAPRREPAPGVTV